MIALSLIACAVVLCVFVIALERDRGWVCLALALLFAAILVYGIAGYGSPAS